MEENLYIRTCTYKSKSIFLCLYIELAIMRTFREYSWELASVEKSVADKKKSIQEKTERKIWRLDGKFSKFLKNPFINWESEQVKYRELMESELSTKKQQLMEQEKEALAEQDKKIDDFKSMSGCEYRLYQVLIGVIEAEEKEKKMCERDISVIPIIIEQLKKELSLKKSEQQVASQRKKVASQRKSVLEVLNKEVLTLNENRDNYKSQIWEALEEILDEEENVLQQADISTIQTRIEWLSKKIPWLEKQLRWKKSDYKQILKELNGIISENAEKEKEMIEALKYAEIWMLIRKLREPLQDLMDKHNVWKEFLRSLCRYLRNEWKFSRGMAFLNWEEDEKLQISQKHVDQWTKKYWVDFIQDLVQLLLEEWIEIIQEELKDEEEGEEEIQEPETSNKPISSEENEKRKLIKWLENSNSISDSISVLKYLWFRFEDEDAFVSQVREAQNEWLQWVAENINRWIIKYMIGVWNIDYRNGKKGVNWCRIALSCNGRKPRILLKRNENWDYTIVCIAPHKDYENILLWQTKNYFQTWEWNWMERGENWGKKWRA